MKFVLVVAIGDVGACAIDSKGRTWFLAKDRGDPVGWLLVNKEYDRDGRLKNEELVKS